MTKQFTTVFTFGVLVLGLAVVPALGAEHLRGMDREGGDWIEITLGLPPANAIFAASANGFAQVPAVLTHGRAFFRARVISGGSAIEYELRYDLAGSLRRVAMHIGQPGVNGAVAVNLCMPDAPGLTGTPTQPCPEGNIGTLDGLILEQDLMPQASGQGVVNLETLIAAMASRITYIDITTDRFAAQGEVRGQIAPLRLSGGGGPGGPVSSGPGGQSVGSN